MTRKLTTILAADVAGYSRLMERSEELTLASLAACREILDAIVDRHGGRIFGSAGDGFVAEFPSTVEAVHCALNFQREIEQRNSRILEDERLTFRVGVSVGDVVVERKSLYGHGVNVAVRVESLANPGEVLVTSETFTLVRRRVDFTFEDLGEKQVKNLLDPIRVFRVVSTLHQPNAGVDSTDETHNGLTFVPGCRHVERPHGKKRPGIVVLPFENLSGDREQAYFCDGLTHDLTTDLSRFHDLFVVAANSAFVYKGRPMKTQEIASDLGIQYLLEGSVRRIDRWLRINVQLIEAETGRHLWAQRFDKELGEIFKVTDELIGRIVATLIPRLATNEQSRALRSPPQIVDAYDAFLRGAHELTTHVAEWEDTDKNLCQACRCFELAIELDPGYARAHGWLAFAIVHRVREGWLPKADLQRAEELAIKAVELAADDYDTHWALGAVYAMTDRLEMAKVEYDLALEINPNDATLLADSAETLVFLGQPKDAVKRVHSAMEVDPFYPDWYRWSLGWALYVAHEYEKSNEVLKSMIHPMTQSWAIMAANHAWLAMQKGEQGDESGWAAQQQFAGKAMMMFRERRPKSTIDREAAGVYFRDQADRQHWIDGLRLAGLPG